MKGRKKPMAAADAAEPDIGEEGWRPTKTHPLAELFPALAPDDLDALVDDIRENGQQHAIIIAEDGTLIDGRMRLKACELARIEPWYEFINGEDPIPLIWSVNAKRRHMTKAQLAMIAAMGLIEPIKPGDQTKAAKAAGVSVQRLNLALTVREHAPHLVDQIIAGPPGISLDKAYQEALAIKRETEWRTDGLRMLRDEDRDLAQRVTDEEISFEDARKELEKRKREQEAVRDSVLLGMSHGMSALMGFRQSEVLPAVAAQLTTDDGLAHLKRYFPNGMKEFGEKLTDAEAGLSEIRRIYNGMNGDTDG